jgi:hypothetical protein
MSPYLESAARRCALPIRVEHDGVCFAFSTHCMVWFAETSRGARALYLRVVSTLEPDPGTSSPAGSSGGCSVLSTPRGEL